jgi:hypothetical protein
MAYNSPERVRPVGGKAANADENQNEKEFKAKKGKRQSYRREQLTRENLYEMAA